MGYAYTLNCGQFVGNRDGRPVTAPMDQVSIAFDRDEGFLIKHGRPDLVAAYVEDAKARLRSVDAAEFGDKILVMTGRFPLEELNRCLDVSGYAGVLYERAKSGKLPELALDVSTLNSPTAAGATDRGTAQQIEADERHLAARKALDAFTRTHERYFQMRDRRHPETGALLVERNRALDNEQARLFNAYVATNVAGHIADAQARELPTRDSGALRERQVG